MIKDTNLALALENLESPQPQQEKRPHIKKLIKSKPIILRKQVICSVMGIGYVALLCGTLMFANAGLAEYNKAFLESTKRLDELEMEHTRLDLEVERLSSLKTIEKTAREQLGMIKPDQSQVRYIQLEKQNKIVVNQKRNDLLSSLSHWVDRVQEYFLR